MQATASLERVAATLGRRPRVMLVGLGSAVAAFIYVAMRASTARSVAHLHSFAGYCERVQPPDAYPCHMTFTAPTRAYLLATLLIWVGLAGIALVLALGGRGAWSFAPLVALGVVQAVVWLFPAQLEGLPLLGVQGHPYWAGGTVAGGAGYWAGHSLRASLVDLALLATPGLLALAAVRPARLRLTWRGRPRFVLTTIASLAAGATVAWFADGVTWRNLGYSTGIPIWAPAAAIATFGLLLPRAAWKPWSIGLAAILLSGGPSVLLVSSALGLPTTLWFAGAAPLAAIGALASAAEPIAIRWEQRTAPPARGTGRAVASRGSVRPVVLLDALVVGLLVATVVAASADALPVRLETALPTYLGLRERADRARGEQDLLMAIHAFATFRDRRAGTPFDAAAGSRLEPALTWRDVTEHTGRFVHFVISVSRPRPSIVRFTTLTPSGALCAEATSRSGWMPTYGVGEITWGNGVARSARTAIGACGSQPLTLASIPDLAPVAAAMCDGEDHDIIIVCRVNQVEVRRTLASPRGAG